MIYYKQNFQFKLLIFLLIISLLNLTNCARTSPYRVSNFFIDKAIYELREKRIAVLPFENLTKIDEATLLVTDEFNLQLGKLGKFELVERIKIEELFKEQDLGKNKRIDETTAVKIGKMLGAHAVILGVITKYVPYGGYKEVTQTQQSTHPSIIIEDHKPHEPEDEWDIFDTIILIGAVISVIGIIYLLFFQPSAEVGISVRMINVETGQHLWQARDTFKGNRPSVKKLVKSKEERKRLRKDIDFLTRLLCQKLTETLK
jgi:TolB-like protein